MIIAKWHGGREKGWLRRRAESPCLSPAPGDCESLLTGVMLNWVEGKDRRHFCNKTAQSTVSSHLSRVLPLEPGEIQTGSSSLTMERYCYMSKGYRRQRYIHRYTWLSSQHILYQDVAGSTVGVEANLPARDVVCAQGRNGQPRLLMILLFVLRQGLTA